MGLTGIGRGVFLAPLVIGFGWAAEANGGVFSALHLGKLCRWVGSNLVGGQRTADRIWLYAGAVLIGAIVGTAIRLRYLSHTATRYVLAAILASAGHPVVISLGHPVALASADFSDDCHRAPDAEHFPHSVALRHRNRCRWLLHLRGNRPHTAAALPIERDELRGSFDHLVGDVE